MLYLILSYFLVLVSANNCPNDAFYSEQSPSNCYIFEKQKLSWHEAEKFCDNQFGGRLAYPQDIFDGILFSSYAYNLSLTDYWIGSNNFYNTSIWTYSDGSPLNYTAWLIWDKNEPIETDKKRCASINALPQRWKSSDCKELKPFVCEIVRILPSNPWIHFNATGYQYKAYNFSTTWKNAELICNKENSHLISIHSIKEMIFATVMIKPYTVKNNFESTKSQAQTWIGLFTQDHNKSWMWLDQSPYNDSIHKELWAPNEPDNPGRQNCGNIWTENPCYPYRQLRFYNRICYLTTQHFICKKPI